MSGTSSDEVIQQRSVKDRDLSGLLHEPLGSIPAPGVLVLHGGGTSNERGYTTRYARLLAHHGYAALDLDYFDTPETPPDLVDVPLEYFSRAIDWLTAQESVQDDRVGTVAWSRGTEAQLLVGARDHRVSVVIAYVPSVYAFPGLSRNEPKDGTVSAWSRNSEPVPFVSPYEGIEDEMDESSYVRFRRTIERAADDVRERAMVPVEEIKGPVLFISAGDDAVWPAYQFAETAIDRLAAHDHSWSYEHCHYPEAGHGMASPYQPISEELAKQLGGTRAGNTYAEADAWRQALNYLQRGLTDRSES